MKQSSKTALGGIVAALSISLMFSISIVPFCTYAVPAAAAVMLIPIVIEINKKWALGVYFCVSFLGLILVPNKEVAVIYAAFFGYYPVLKALLEKKMGFITEWIFKLLIFNLSMSVSYYVMLRFMGIRIDEMETLGMLAIPILLVMGSVAFILYDYAVSKIIVLYIRRFQKQFRKMFK